jgi:hypothetical protein
MAPVEGSLKVIGKRIDIAPTGPIPGKTPTRVPTKLPKKQNNKLSGWSAIEKP